MDNSLKYGLIIVAIGAFFFISQSNNSNYVAEEDEIDLNIVLDITVNTLDAFQQELDLQGSSGQD